MNAGEEASEVLPPAFSLDALIASLLGEPYRLRLEEIADLTDRQIVDLYGHPRDDEGRPKVVQPVPERELTREEQRAVLFGMGRNMGISEAELEAAWRAKYGEADQTG